MLFSFVFKYPLPQNCNQDFELGVCCWMCVDYIKQSKQLLYVGIGRHQQGLSLVLEKSEKKPIKAREALELVIIIGNGASEMPLMG